jgi:hypothetical protein
MTRVTSFIVKSLVTLLIGGGTLAANLQAQGDPITVDIPFPFTVGTQSIGPGTYTFSLLPSQFLLSVTNVKTGGIEMFSVRPERQRSVEQHGRVVFHNSDGYSVLNEVHFPGTGTFSEVIQRHAAARMEAKKSSTGNSISVAQR